MTKGLVSVILPTHNRHNVALENIQNILAQDYKQLEIIVCDDSDKKYYQKHNVEFRDNLANYGNVKYVYCARFDIDGNKDYGLARARNFGCMEADGEYLVFLDDRITPANPQMVSIFVEAVKKTKKTWFFGDKGSQKTSFVENCSAIRKSEMIDSGLFCERIDKYGGMSRELIGRFSRQGFTFAYLEAAKAKQVCKSGGWEKKEQEIPVMKALLNKIWNR